MHFFESEVPSDTTKVRCGGAGSREPEAETVHTTLRPLTSYGALS